MTIDAHSDQHASTRTTSALPAGEPVFLELEDPPPENASQQAGKAKREPAVPAWFTRKRARSAAAADKPHAKERQKSKPSAALIPVSGLAAEEVWREPSLLQKLQFLFRRHFKTQAAQHSQENPRYERFEEFVRFALSGSGISLLVHLLLLCILALIVLSEPKDGQFKVFASESGDDVMEFEDIVDTRLDSVGADWQQAEAPQIDVVETDNAEFLQPELPESPETKASAAGSGEGAAEGDGQGGMVAVPKGGNVVKKGSFTAWTVPEDPAPGQNYRIVIQVKLPEGIRRYHSRDLSGKVIGTDGYRQAIPGIRRVWLPVKDRHAQLVIFVPGAAKLVRDTIDIRSRVLNEKQELEIVF